MRIHTDRRTARALSLLLAVALTWTLSACAKTGPDAATTTRRPAEETALAGETGTDATATDVPETREPTTDAVPTTEEPTSAEPETDPKAPPADAQSDKIGWEDFSFTMNAVTYASHLTPEDFSASDGWIENTQIDYGEGLYPRDYILAPDEEGFLVFTRADSDVEIRLYYINENKTDTRMTDCPCYSVNFYGETGTGFAFTHGLAFGAAEADVIDAIGKPDREQTFTANPSGKVMVYSYGICALVFIVRGDSLTNVQFVYG